MKLVDNLVKFANETSIGGLVQIAKSSSSKTKRITWFLLFCSSIMYAGFQISDEVICKYIYLFKDLKCLSIKTDFFGFHEEN